MTETPTADYDAGSAKRDALLDATLRLHDLRYGTGHCDRKYVQVCSRFQELIFEAGRVTPPGCAQPDAWSAPTVETSREGQSGGSDARDTRAREVVNNPRISEPTGTVSTPVW